MEDPTDKWPEAINPNDNLPEAPASANVKVWIDGFGCMFTIRGKKVNDVVDKTVILISNAKQRGWKSTWDKNETFRGTTVSPKANQESCPHTNETIKKATGHNNPENKDRIYKACLDCNKFLEWVK